MASNCTTYIREVIVKKFSIPGFFSKFTIIQSFIDYYYNHRDLFIEDRCIDSCYDSYGTLLWRGGRIPHIENPNLNMLDILDFFNQYPSIELRHVFSNCLLDENMTHDYFCNKFTKEVIRLQDKVIINNKYLIEHFKKNYPNIPIIYSTTMDITDIEQVNQLSEQNIYVLNYNYNNDNTYLEQLKYPQNIEILCGEPCIDNCPYRAQHYISISKGALGIADDENDINECPFGSYNLTPIQIMKRKNAITNERIDELYNIGFQYFKISGRTLPPPSWLELILYYLAKPEYIDQIRQELLLKWW